MKTLDLRRYFEAKKNSVQKLGEVYAVDVYGSGKIGNFIVSDKPFVQLIFDDDGMRVYTYREDGDGLEGTPHTVLGLDDDISVLGDFVPCGFLPLLMERIIADTLGKG